MNFNNTSTREGMIQMCEDLCGFDNGDISGDTDLLNRFTRMLNDRYNQTSNWIWKASGDWQFDDRGQTTLPEATTDLVGDQQDYELPSTAQKLMRVEVKDQNGDYHVLRAFDESAVKGIAMSEWYETAGIPIFYDIKGRSLILYPKPGTGFVTLSAGLKIYVSRDVIQFNSTATSQEPGFSLNFHRMIPLGASLDYSIGAGKFNTVNAIKPLILETRTDMQEFYSRRHRDPILPKIKPNTENYI